jgi:predicted DNA-binding transcriptional regulator AlpA
MAPTPQQLPWHIFEKSALPKNVSGLFPGQTVITFEKSEVPGEALFRLAAQLLKLMEQERPDFARGCEGDKCQEEAIFRLGSQLWKIIGQKWPDYFGGSRVPRQIVDLRVARQEKQSSPLLTYPELKSKKGISYCRLQIDRLEKKHQFPQRIKIGRGRIAWYEHEIDDWVRERAEARPLRVRNKRKPGI